MLSQMYIYYKLKPLFKLHIILKSNSDVKLEVDIGMYRFCSGLKVSQGVSVITGDTRLDFIIPGCQCKRLYNSRQKERIQYFLYKTMVSPFWTVFLPG